MSIINKLIEQLHILIFAYALWGAFEMYEEFSKQEELLTNSVADTKVKINVVKKKAEEIKVFIAQQEEWEQIVNTVIKNVETVQRQIPSDIIDSQVLDYMREETGLLNIKDAKFNAGKETPNPLTISKDYSISASGTFLQFAVFFERLANADRIYNIKSLVLKNDIPNQKGRYRLINMETTIEAFKFNPNFLNSSVSDVNPTGDIKKK